VLERKRPIRQQNNDWLDRHRRKIDLALKELGDELGEKAWCNGEAYSLADIATGCALAYLDLRHAAIDWRAAYPNLASSPKSWRSARRSPRPCRRHPERSSAQLGS